MKIYLAASYHRREELCLYRSLLISSGHVVTSRWLDESHNGEEDNDGANDEFRARCAQEDLEDILASDCVISFTETKETQAHPRGGRHVEFGYALATGKALILVGHRESVFHFLPDLIFFSDWESAIDSLQEIESTLSRRSALRRRIDFFIKKAADQLQNDAAVTEEECEYFLQICLRIEKRDLSNICRELAQASAIAGRTTIECALPTL